MVHLLAIRNVLVVMPVDNLTHVTIHCQLLLLARSCYWRLSAAAHTAVGDGLLFRPMHPMLTNNLLSAPAQAVTGPWLLLLPYCC